MWIQTGVTVRKRLSWVMTSVTLTFDLWPWPFAWTLRRSLVITPESFMMLRWWEHSQKGVTDRRTDGQTDRRTENTICRAAWSQLKIMLPVYHVRWIQYRFHYRNLWMSFGICCITIENLDYQQMWNKKKHFTQLYLSNFPCESCCDMRITMPVASVATVRHVNCPGNGGSSLNELFY